LGTISTLAIFLLSYKITKSEKISLFTALLLAISGDHIRWSATAETNISSLLFIMLSLLFLISKERSLKHYIFILFFIAFSATFRIEAFMLIPLFVICQFFVLFFKGPEQGLDNVENKNKKPWLKIFILILILFLLIPSSIQNLSYRNDISYISDENTMTEYIKNNTLNLLKLSLPYIPRIFSHEFITISLTISVLTGIYIFLINFHKYKKLILPLIFYLIILIIYIFTPFPHLGGDLYKYSKSRFFMMFYPAILILGSLFISKINLKKANKIKSTKNILLGIFAIAILISQSTSLIQVPSMLTSPEDELKTRIIEKLELEIPPECVVLDALPPVISATNNVKTLDIKVFKNYKYYPYNKSCFLFHLQD
jgi:hypothetical protein